MEFIALLSVSSVVLQVGESGWLEARRGAGWAQVGLLLSEAGSVVHGTALDMTVKAVPKGHDNDGGESLHGSN